MTGRTPLPAPPRTDPGPCPPAADLEHMLADVLPPERAGAVEAHVADCPHCQAELERLTDTPSSVGLDPSVTRTGRLGEAARPPNGPGPLPDVPGYAIERELGRGGMGVVYQARQLRLNRTVALKMILAGEFASAEVTRRFLAEAEIVARISHPNIVQVFDFGDVHGRAFFAMEFVDGGTLADRLTGRPWPPAEAARLIEDVARGLHHAHERGVVHRDLKPANILLSPRSPVRSPQSKGTRLGTADGGPGTPKVADFGVAKLTEGGGGLTLSQALIGSPSYMSPEQAEGRSAAVGPASDVHALGAVLYELLTGRKAFDGPTPLSVLEQVRGVDPPPPSRLARGVPRDLETICRACLEKDPARRYASAALVAEDLRRFRAGETILARPVGRGRRVVRWARRHPVESGLVAALFLALALGLLGTSWKWREAVRERNAATGARVRAETNETAANEARRQADQARDAWQRITSEAALTRGDDLARRGEVTAGLFWMIESLRTAPPDDPHWADVVRRNLAGWEARVHALRHVVRFDSPVNAAAVSPDGSVVFVGGANGEPALVDAATGAVVARFPRVPGGVECVAFTPDGKRVVYGGLDGFRRVDVADRRLIDEKPFIGGKTFRCAISADGRRLAVATLEQQAAVYDLDSGMPVRTFDTGSKDVAFWSVDLSPDGKRVAFGLKHNHAPPPVEARVWAVDGGPGDPPVVRLNHPAAVLSVRFHPTDDRTLLTSCMDGKVRLWDLGRGQLRGDPLTHPHPTVEQAAFTPDGRAVVTACADGWVRWWGAATGRPLGSSLRHDGGVYGAAFDPRLRFVATHAADHTLRLWSVSAAALPAGSPLPAAGKAAVAADGSRAVVAGNTRVRLVDTATGEPVGPAREAAQDRETPIAVGPGGRRFATVDPAGVLRVWDDGRPVIEEKLPRRAHGLAFDPAGRRLAVVGREGKVELWDLDARKRAHTLEHTGIAWMASFDPTGQWLAVGGDGRPTARLWDLSGPEPVGDELPTADGVNTIQFRPDGRAIVTQFHRTARLWDAAAKAPLGPTIGPFDATFHMTFSPDGRLLVSWCGRQVRLWDAATARPLPGRTFDHPADVTGVVTDRDSRVLLAALADRTAQFWDLRTGRTLGPPAEVGARPLAVGRAGDRLFAVGDDGRVHPLDPVAPATGSADELAAHLRRRTGYQMAAGTVSPLPPPGWGAAEPDR